MNGAGVVFLILLLVAVAAFTYPEPETKVTAVKLEGISAACEPFGGWESFDTTMRKTEQNGKKVRLMSVTCKNGVIVQYDVDAPVLRAGASVE